MSFRYDPKQATQCLPEDDYQATIKDALDTTSKAGNPMLVITFTVHSHRGEFELKDYIVEEMTWKLKRIATAIGAESSFLKGEFFAADYIGKNLTLFLTIEDHPKYGEQNRIKNYKANGSAPMAHPEPMGITSADVPF